MGCRKSCTAAAKNHLGLFTLRSCVSLPRMTPDDLEDDLCSSVRYALQAYRYKPPRTHDASERDRYFSAVAAAVVAHVKLSGWDLSPPQTLQKRPPLPHHSTPG